MKQLIEEQKEFNEKFSYIADALDFYTKAHYPTIKKSGTEHLKDITDWHKQSLKQFIDELIAREEGEIKEFQTQKDGEYHFGENQKVIGWNMAKEFTIAHLKKTKRKHY